MADFSINADSLIASTRAAGHALSEAQERVAREVLAQGSRASGFFEMIVNAIMSAVAGVQNFLGGSANAVSERLSDALNGGSEVGDLRNIDDRAHTIYRNLVMGGVDITTAAAMTGNVNGAALMAGNIRDQFLSHANISPATRERGSTAFVEAASTSEVRYPVADNPTVTAPVLATAPGSTRTLT